MNRPVACSSVIKRTAPPSPAAGRRMKRRPCCGTRISAFIALPSLARASCSAIVKPRLGMNGNGCAGSIGKRRQHRKDVLQEIIFEPGPLGLRQRRGRRPARCPPWQAPRAARASAPAGRWRGARPPRRCARAARPGSARPGSRSVMPARTWPFRPATRTMKNSSRLLAEIDRKRSRSSSGWLAFSRLLQHPAIEMQPGQLAVDEALGARGEIGHARRNRRGDLLARNFFRKNSGLRHVDNRCERSTRG